MVTDIDGGGGKIRTYVRAAGAVLAWQNGYSTNGNVSFQAWDAGGMSYRTTEPDGDLFTQAGYEGAPAELDPAGGNMGKVTHRQNYDPGNYCVGCGIEAPTMSMFINGQTVTASLDGMPISLSQVDALMQSQNASRCPSPGCSVNVRYNGANTIAYWSSFVDGYAGFVPANSAYAGGGFLRPMGPEGRPAVATGGRNRIRDTDLQRLNGVTGRDERHLRESRFIFPFFLPTIKLEGNEVDNLKNDVDRILANPDCTSFIKELLEKASLVADTVGPGENMSPNSTVTDDIGSLFEQVRGMGGFRRGTDPYSDLSSVRGTIAASSATVYFGSVYNFDGLSGVDLRRRQIGAAITAIHELIHFSYDEGSLARAVAVITKGKVPAGGLIDASRYWGDELTRRCLSSPDIFK